MRGHRQRLTLRIVWTEFWPVLVTIGLGIGAPILLNGWLP